jgi:hypothetical protein
MNNVEELRKSGYKVWVKHFRRGSLGGPNPRGGKTVVEVTTPDGVTLVGVSRCSRKENFNKRLGVRIALGRAFTSAGDEQEGVRVFSGR